MSREIIDGWTAEFIKPKTPQFGSDTTTGDPISRQPEQTYCDYCHEDSDGFVKPIEKNSHAVIYGGVLHLKAKGWSGKAQIKYCPMCGRMLER